MGPIECAHVFYWCRRWGAQEVRATCRSSFLIVYRWDERQQSPVHSITAHKGGIRAVAPNHYNEHLVASAGQDGVRTEPKVRSVFYVIITGCNGLGSSEYTGALLPAPGTQR